MRERATELSSIELSSVVVGENRNKQENIKAELIALFQDDSMSRSSIVNACYEMIDACYDNEPDNFFDTAAELMNYAEAASRVTEPPDNGEIKPSYHSTVIDVEVIAAGLRV